MKEKFTLWSFWDGFWKMLGRGFELFCTQNQFKIFIKIIGSTYLLGVGAQSSFKIVQRFFAVRVTDDDLAR